MDRIREIITKKPPFFLLVTAAYAAVVVLIKWNIYPTPNTILFLAGAVVGVYLLDFAEAFSQLKPSPFRSVVFCAGLVIVSVFIVSSSGSYLAAGLVLTLYLTLILWQLGQLKLAKNLDSWFNQFSGKVPVSTQMTVAGVFAAIFILETLLFIRQTLP